MPQPVYADFGPLRSAQFLPMRIILIFIRKLFRACAMMPSALNWLSAS